MGTAPRAFNREVYHQKNIVFYGTDDGAQDGSFSEFEEIRAHYNNAAPERKENIHMISVVGGMYGLNLIPLWKPKRLTIFDINPVAIAYFKVIHRTLLSSSNAEEFLQRLTDGNMEAETEDESFVRDNIILRRRNELPTSRGSSKRSYEESWQNVLQNFELTKEILTAPDFHLEILNEPMESESFRERLRQGENLWIYPSNITEFHFFNIEFHKPKNLVVLQIIFPNQVNLLDVSTLVKGDEAVQVKFEIPLKAEIIEPLVS